MSKEPEAWLSKNGVVHRVKHGDLTIPLYTKCEWVGLTDEDFYGQSELQVMAMKYAEAKLKEKNSL